MLVTIRQTKSRGQNLFQVEEQGPAPLPGPDPLGRPAPAPGGRKHAPAHLFRRPGPAALPHFLPAAGQRPAQPYQIQIPPGRLGPGGGIRGLWTRPAEQQGSFYTQIDGLLTSQLTICYGEEQYDCYPRALGKIYVASIFRDGRQIAQITKPLDTWDLLDIYYLHLAGRLPASAAHPQLFHHLSRCRFLRPAGAGRQVFRGKAPGLLLQQKQRQIRSPLDRSGLRPGGPGGSWTACCGNTRRGIPVALPV